MGGEAAVEAAKEAGWDTITAIGIAGVQGDSTSEARMGGYKAGVEKAGGTYLDAETQYADGVSDKAVTAMEAIIQSHPEGIAIVVCNNDDMAVGAARQQLPIRLTRTPFSLAVAAMLQHSMQSLQVRRP